jgi:hypothetical protein
LEVLEDKVAQETIPLKEAQINAPEKEKHNYKAWGSIVTLHDGKSIWTQKNLTQI